MKRTGFLSALVALASVPFTIRGSGEGRTRAHVPVHVDARCGWEYGETVLAPGQIAVHRSARTDFWPEVFANTGDHPVFIRWRARVRVHREYPVWDVERYFIQPLGPQTYVSSPNASRRYAVEAFYRQVEEA